MRNEWDLWGMKSYLEATEQWSEKANILLNADKTATEKIMRERERMEKALEYLSEKGKLKDESTETDLSNKISFRIRELSNYMSNRYFELSALLREAEKAEHERVEQKSKEMQEKYTQ